MMLLCDLNIGDRFRLKTEFGIEATLFEVTGKTDDYIVYVGVMADWCVWDIRSWQLMWRHEVVKDYDYKDIA